MTDVTGDVGVEDTRARFGGVDIPATIAGALAALGTAALLAGIAAGAGSVGYQLGLDGDTDDVTTAGLIAGLATLALAFLIGGWVAGRVARYDGGRNGLLSVLWFVLLAAATAALGAWVGRGVRRVPRRQPSAVVRQRCPHRRPRSPPVRWPWP